MLTQKQNLYYNNFLVIFDVEILKKKKPEWYFELLIEMYCKIKEQEEERNENVHKKIEF